MFRSFLNSFRIKALKGEKYHDYLRNLGLKIGSHCEIYRQVNFGSEPYLIELGDYVRVTDGVKFITHDGGVWVLRNLGIGLEHVDVFGKIIVGNNVHIGTNAIIMPNVTIGNNCVIATGAVVTKNIPDNSVVAGVPARVIQSVEEYQAKVRAKSDNTKHFSSQEKKDYLLRKYSKN